MGYSVTSIDDIDGGGSGHWRVEGEEVPVRVGTFLRFDPETTRQPVAGPTG